MGLYFLTNYLFSLSLFRSPISSYIGKGWEDSLYIFFPDRDIFMYKFRALLDFPHKLRELQETHITPARAVISH